MRSQSDPMRLVRDWMALLNHGQQTTAVGGSDSHDVARYIVGQGRTYIACRDDDPAHIDIAAAVRAVRAGRALVSLGLLTNLTVDGRFHVGDVATGSQPALMVTATVLGPSWSRVDRIELFADGIRLREQAVDAAAGSRPGTKAKVTWAIPSPSHDIYLVAVASGPGVTPRSGRSRVPTSPPRGPGRHASWAWPIPSTSTVTVMRPGPVPGGMPSA